MNSDHVERLNTMISSVEIAMLTSVGEDDTLHSRPMVVQAVQDDGTVWFFTSRNASAAYESDEDCRVNVSYVDAKRSVFISISGAASLSDDREKMAQLWDPRLSAWFPKGLEDPNLRLLCVQIERAEYWDVTQNALALLAGFARKALTGKTEGVGTHERIV
ncbi:MAG: pyridoxamine 5'-phosphate oxidase family protein [Candidatus Eremiobacteraeota bacterium]|nr:pyridoxamine 5'-phosphate oxidase family protein [Candidatus Eremiobacteraeota bacterium]